jgi:Kef-type K+ transport system membrane component KefB/nucleotide-binding universal stress UspA family protein
MLAPLLSIVPTLPFTDPVLIVALATLIFLVVPVLAERVRVPGVIGLIVAGAAVGPHGFGLLARDQTIVLLGTVGLLYLMLMVGLELDLHQFSRYRSRSIVFGTLSFMVPAVFGAAAGLAMGYSLASSLLLASAFSSHTLLAYPIASRLGIIRNEAVTTALGGTILTEILALLLLAVVANQGRGAALDLAFWTRLGVSFGVYVAVVMWGLPRLGRWFFRRSGDGGTEFIFVMTALFTVAYLSHAAGVEPIVGALLAGLALNRLVPAQGPLMNRIHFVGNTLFIPFFLLSVGMLVNVRALDSVRAWGIAAVLATGVLFSKWLASWITTRAFRYDPAEGWVVFGLTVPHAAGTLAIILVGYDIGLLDQTEVNAVVVMILATCLAGPWAVERFGRVVARSEQARPYDPSAAPRRVMIPLANPATAEALMDLAFAVRGADTDEPVIPLSVAPDEGHSTEAWVAEAEQMLAGAVRHATAAEVSVRPVTRVDANVAAGIARGVAETRASVVVIGWDGRRGGGRAMFGSVLDQVLERTRQMVLVAKLGHPLNVTRRLVVLVPPAADRHPGFADALAMVNRIAGGIGAGMAAVVVGTDARGRGVAGGGGLGRARAVAGERAAAGGPGGADGRAPGHRRVASAAGKAPRAAVGAGAGELSRRVSRGGGSARGAAAGAGRRAGAGPRGAGAGGGLWRRHSPDAGAGVRRGDGAGAGGAAGRDGGAVQQRDRPWRGASAHAPPRLAAAPRGPGDQRRRDSAPARHPPGAPDRAAGEPRGSGGRAPARPGPHRPPPCGPGPDQELAGAPRPWQHDGLAARGIVRIRCCGGLTVETAPDQVGTLLSLSRLEPRVYTQW